MAEAKGGGEPVRAGRESDYFDAWITDYARFYPTGSRLDREFRLSRMLVLAGRSWTHRIDGILRTETGHSRARWQTLFALGFAQQPSTMTELAGRLRVQWPTLVRVLSDMEAAGLIRREDNPADRRSRLVYLTEAGGEAISRIQPILDRERAQVMSGLSDAEVEQCCDLLGRVFDQIINPPGDPTVMSADGGMM